MKRVCEFDEAVLSAKQSAPMTVERVAEEKRRDGRLFVRAVVADKFDISAPRRLFVTVMPARFTRTFPVNDHGRAARVQFLIWNNGHYFYINAEARDAHAPARRIRRARARTLPMLCGFEREICLREMRPRAGSLDERAARKR